MYIHLNLPTLSKISIIKMLNKPAKKTVEEESDKDLSYLLHLGKQRAENTRPKTIFVVGESRVGKSTLFNHLLGVRLRGVRGEGKQRFNIFYEADFSGAQAKFAFKSVTLLPNIEDVELDKQILALEDMAGFNDKNRGYKGVMMVSYMLVESLKNADQSKFILVCEEANISQSQIEDIIKPFVNFIKMFKYENFFEKEKEEFVEKKEMEKLITSLVSSVVLVVTKTQKSYESTQARLTEIFEELEESQEAPEERKMVARLLKNIIENKRISLFEKAKEGQFASSSTLFEDMKKKNWDWFGFKENSSLIDIPFKRDYSSLKQIEKNNYKQFQENKKDLFDKYSSILKKFIDKSIDKSSAPTISYEQEISELEEFVRVQDKYEDENMIENLGLQTKKPEKPINENITELELLNKLTEISDQIIKLPENSSKGNSSTLRDYQHLLKKILSIFIDIYCLCRSEEIVFMKSIFIYLQSIEEFASMDEVQGNVGAGAIQKIKDGFARIMPDMIEITCRYIQNCVPKEKNLDQIEAKIDSLLENYREDVEEYLEDLKRKQIQVKIMRGDFQIKNKLFSTALKSYLNTLQFLERQRKQQKTDQNLQNFEFRLTEIYCKVGKCLQGMKLFNLALKMFQKITFVTEMNNCYEMMIKYEKDKKNCFDFMKKQALFCEMYGRVPDAIKIYQKILSSYEFRPKQKTEIKELLENCLVSSTRFVEYREVLSDTKPLTNDENLIEEVKEQQVEYESRSEKSFATLESIEESILI